MTVGDPVSGIILAGGKSRRLGVDKTTLPWPPGNPEGRTLLDHTVEKLRLVCADLIVVGYRGERPLPQGVRAVSDAFPDSGPLGGLCAGLEAARQEHAFAVPVDMPFLSVELLEWLIAQPRDYDVLAPIYGLVQTLHAIYAKRCVEVIRRRLAAGQRSMIGLLEDPALRVSYVEQAQVERLDPGARSLANLNTPEDLEEAVLSLRRTEETQ
ncbi:MAG TPA: molybdenum cofactor guanylyltransferase [Chloroflexota bacterium]|nr:molybdenum cofactor guanylyltransferase [Chloroflexota bacterium]